LTNRFVALAGLAGANNHGAGFLAALRQHTEETGAALPDMVTATSGQIYVLSEFLKGTDLSTLLDGSPTLVPNFSNYLMKVWTGNITAEELIAPTGLLTLARPDEFYEEVAENLNNAPFIVAFNGFSLNTGSSVIYTNAPGALGSATLPIDADAVKNALYLSLYGLDNSPTGIVDGAYHRAALVADALGFLKVFFVRPIAENTGAEVAPKTIMEQSAWNTKRWFQASYRAEAMPFKVLHSLERGGAIVVRAPLTEEYIEIIPDSELVFFKESKEMFETSKNTSLEVLRKMW